MRLCALFVVLAGLLIAPAWGAVTEYACSRNLEIQGQIARDGAPPGVDVAGFSRKTTLTPVPFQQAFSDSVGAPQPGNAGAMASQLSSLNLGPTSELHGASFAGSTSVGGAAGSSWSANAHAASEFSFSFTANEPFTYNLDYALSAMSLVALQSTSHAWLKLTSGTGSTLIDLSSGTGAAPAGHLTGILGPGQYTLAAVCNSDGVTAAAPGMPSFNAFSSLIYTLNLAYTPEPATLALLALAGCLARRR